MPRSLLLLHFLHPFWPGLFVYIDLPPGCKSVSWGLHFSSTTRCYAARPNHFQRLPTWLCQQVVDCIWMTSEGSPFGRNRKDTRSKRTIQSTPARHKEYFINLCLVQFPKNTSMKACSFFFGGRELFHTPHISGSQNTASKLPAIKRRGGGGVLRKGGWAREVCLRPFRPCAWGPKRILILTL